MDCEQGSTCSLDPSHQRHCLLLSWQASNFHCHWDFQLFVQSLNEGDNYVGLLQEVSTVIALFGDALWTPTIDIDCIAIVLDVLGCLEQVIGVVRTELDR